jgi:hypothetical protein
MIGYNTSVAPNNTPNRVQNWRGVVTCIAGFRALLRLAGFISEGFRWTDSERDPA